MMRMNVISVVTLVLAVSLGLATQIAMAQEAAVAPTTAPAGRPVVEVAAAEYAFGTFWQDDVVTHTFTLVNAGTAPLVIERVRAACGCTTVKDYARSVAPGATWELAATLKTRGYSGPQNKPIYVETNDPDHKQIQFRFVGEVKPRFELQPRSLNFGRLHADAATTQTLTITNMLDKPATLRNATSDSEAFFVDLREVEAGKRYELRIATVPLLNEGTNRAKITIETGVAEQPTIEVTAMAYVTPRVELSPSVVSVPEKRDSDLRRPLTIRNHGETPVHVTGVDVTGSDVTAEIKPTMDGKLYQVWVTVPKDAQIPASGVSLTIKTDDATYATLRASVNATGSTPTASRGPRPVELLVGKPAPTFELATVAGKAVSNETAADAVTVLDFFAPNCGFCKKQMPTVEAVRADYEAKGVRFLYVAQQMGQKAFTQAEIAEVLKTLKVDGEWAMDLEKAVGGLFKVTGYPTMVIVGKGGEIEAVNVGAKADLKERMAKQLDAMLAGKPIPAEAIGG
ncbi:MAG: DUF1573 domain-containing protein [Phycisphaerae bacterium]|nr:DUF1573 domain-containing protein [Phycisphaerae bacterium]